jgi:hypothetical protein
VCRPLLHHKRPSRHTGTIVLRTAPRTTARAEARLLVDIMRIWLEHDPVALALLVIGLAGVELLAFIISLTI